MLELFGAADRGRRELENLLRKLLILQDEEIINGVVRGASLFGQ
jgi:hypothetical protein